MTRFEAYADEHVWVGRIENDADHEASGWHMHPGERLESEPGDFVMIPKGVVHREGNAGDEANDGIVVRLGEGPVTINVAGPDPA